MKKVVRTLKQSLSILLAVAMVITCVPQTATLSLAASDTDIIDTAPSTEAEAPAELEVSTDDSGLVSDDETVIPTDAEEQPDTADNAAAGDDTEVGPTEDNPTLAEDDTALTPDSMEINPDLSGAQVTPFTFAGSDADGGDVTFASNENVTINDAADSKGLTETAGSEAYYFQVKANDGYAITKVSATATGADGKTATLATDASEGEDAQKITFEAAADDYTKYTIPLNATALGDGFSYEDLEALAITITTEEVTSYTITIPVQTAVNATVNITSGATQDTDGNWFTDGTKDLVFTVTPDEGYKVTSVEYAYVGESTYDDQRFEVTSGSYTIPTIAITKDIVIFVVTEPAEMVTISFKDYVNLAASHYEVYQVTEEANGTYTKAATPSSSLIVEKGTDVYFVVEAADMYAIKTVRADKGTCGSTTFRFGDGTSVRGYRIRRVSDNTEITLTIQPDTKTAYQAAFATAEGTDGQYVITTNGTEADTKVNARKVYTALETIIFTVTPNEGYQVDKVEKVETTAEGETGTKTAVSDLSAADATTGARTFTGTFSASEKTVTYEVSVTAIPLENDGGKITFVNNAENLTLAVTSEETAVEPVAGEENAYRVKSGAKYVEFKLTSNNEKILPVVMVGGKEWGSRTEESPYEYKVSASLFADDTTVTIEQVAVEKTITVISNSAKINLNDMTAITAGGTYDTNNSVMSTDEGYEGTDFTDYVEFHIPIDSKVGLNVSACDEYAIGSYFYATERGEVREEVNAKDTIIPLILTDDVTIYITAVSAPSPYTVSLNQGDWSGDEVIAKDEVYPVNYGQTYVATVSKGGMTYMLAKAAIEPEGCSSTVDATYASNQRAAIRVDAADAGKELTVKIWVDEDEDAEEPSVTLKLQVRKAITRATVTGVKNGSLTQTVDTEQDYEIKVTPANADVNNLDVDIKWENGATEADKEAFSATVEEGRLVIATTTAKDAEALAALNTAAQKATIRLADKTKGNKEDGNYPDTAIVEGTSFKLTIEEPKALKNATPTVALKSSNDVELTFTLGIPANTKVAEPALGELWYEVTVTPQGTPTAEDKIKAAATYYFAKDADANTQNETIKVSSADFGSGKAWKFDVTAKVVQTLNDFDLTKTTAEDYETNKAAALTAFASKVKTLTAATKAPYFATKLSLKKGTTNVYTGMENIKIATINFGKDTTYTDDKSITVGDITTGTGYIERIERDAFKVVDGNVYLSLKLSDHGVLEVTPGKHTIRVMAQSPDETWAAYADLVITVNRGIEFLELYEASDKIYKAENQKATLKVTPVYNDDDTEAYYAAKTKKVKDYVLVAVDEDGYPKTGEDGQDVVLTDKKLTVKNGTVTVAKDFDLAAARANGTDKFLVRATSADWTDKASGTSSSVYGYSGLITITDQAMALGDVIVVKYDDDQKGFVPIISQDKKNATSGEFGEYDEEFDCYYAMVTVLKPGVTAKDVYAWEDFVDSSYLTYKSSSAKALGINSYGYINAIKTGKNIKITVSANDGSRASKVLDKIEIENAKPTELGLKVEKVSYDSWSNEDELEALNSDYTSEGIDFTGTTNSVLKLTVMREGENGEWNELDELSDLKVTISKTKVLNKVSAYNQAYTVIANSAAATVKLVYTNAADTKVTKTFTINNNGVKTVAAPRLKASGNLTAGSFEETQTITYTLSGNYDYKGKVVMVNTDAADRNNSKNADRYWCLEYAGGALNTWTKINEDGTFALNFEATSYGIPAGSYKLSFTFGTLGLDGKSVIPDTKPVNMTMKAVAPKTGKASYKPVTTVKMSVYDTAAGKVLTGTGKGIEKELYFNLLNANITGQANHFRELFELDEESVLRLKSTFSDGLKAALLKAGEITENSDAAVIKYITESKSKAAKNDRIGYASYYATGVNDFETSGQTKLTVTFDTKKSTDTYTLTNTTILQGTPDASVQVLKNKKAGAEIADAYVIGCDKDGEFSVSEVYEDTISFTLIDATANAANKYKVTVAVVPTNNYYAADIVAKKEAWEEARDAETPVEATVTAAKQAYVDAITANGIKLTTTVTVGAKASTKNKISVAKNNQKPAFTGGYNYSEGGLESGYDGKNGNYWIHVPYTENMNMTCGIASIDSNDNKLAAAREDGSQNLVSFSTGIQNWDEGRDDFGNGYIDIRLNKQEFDAAVAAGKVKYTTNKKATLSVKATVHFGSKWVDDTENPDNSHWDTETDENGKDAIMTEVISFTLTLPSKSAASDYADAVEAVQEAKEAIEEASVPASWIWNGEGLPLPAAEDGVITLSSRSDKSELLYTLNDLIGNVHTAVKAYAPKDAGVVIRMPQECVGDDSTGYTMTLQNGDLKAPTATKEGTLTVRAELYDAATCDANNEPILEGGNKSKVTTVEFTLTIPALKEKPADVAEAIQNFIAEKKADPDYIAAITGKEDIERDARIAAGLVDEDGNPTNSLRLFVEKYAQDAATKDHGGYVVGDIVVYGYRYGGTPVIKDFEFTIDKLDNLTQTVQKVDGAVAALTATNATTKAEILAAANAAIKNPQFSAVWQKAGEGTLKDENDKDDDGNEKPVNTDGEVYKLKAATREAAGYVIGTIVIVDSEDETITAGNTVSVKLTIAKLADSTEAVKKVKAAVGIDADNSDPDDADVIKALVLKYGNSKETVKAGILEEANKAVKSDGYTVAYKKDTTDTTKELFEFTPAKYREKGTEGQEGYDPGTGTISFTLEITDEAAEGDNAILSDVVEMPQTTTFGPYEELQTFEQAKEDVTAALAAFKEDITDSSFGNAVDQAVIEAAVDPEVTGTGLSVAVEDFDIVEATVKAEGSITFKVVITKKVEDAVVETETIDFEAPIPKEVQTLADAKTKAQAALNAMAKEFTNDDIVTETVPNEEEGEDMDIDVVKENVLAAIKTTVEEVIDTDSFTVGFSKAEDDYIVQTATLSDGGKVKITVTITEKNATEEGNPKTEKVSREWTFAALDQSPEEAEAAANDAIQAYIADIYAEGIDAAGLNDAVEDIKAEIEAFVKDVYTVDVETVDGNVFTKEEADEENPACYKATFLLKYKEGEEDKEIRLPVVIKEKTTAAPEGMAPANSVSANDSRR